MNLHLNKILFRQAIQFTADELAIKAIYVEKDYWVTYVLHTIFNNDIGKYTVFKGGTALSKTHNIIQRFSEDIDLVVLVEEGDNDNKLKKKIRDISKLVETVLPEVDVEDITIKKGMNRKTAHTYNKEFNDDFGQIRDVIIVEATWLGYFEPYSTTSINSLVGQMMLNTNQQKLIEEYNMLPFPVMILDPTRTLCEKIMSLVRHSYTDNPIEDLQFKVRHTYDIHQLLQLDEFNIFFNSDSFNTMLLRVAQDDVASFKNNNKWLAFHPSEALVFKNINEVWLQMAEAYQGAFKNYVYGNLPNQNDVLNTLIRIKDRLAQIKWNVNINL